MIFFTLSHNNIVTSSIVLSLDMTLLLLLLPLLHIIPPADEPSSSPSPYVSPLSRRIREC